MSDISIASYNKLLESKVTVNERHGFEVTNFELERFPIFPHTRDSVKWAVGLGRGLIASSFGLAKSRTQCAIAQLVHEHTKKPFLVICPLGVKLQFQLEDGPVMGQTWRYVRTDEEIAEAMRETPFLITNYERPRDGSITSAGVALLGGVSLDEGSVLRSLGSKTQQTFMELFAKTRYRFVATATPSPNEYKELIYYAEFLGIMDHGQALTRFFKRDSMHAGHLTLFPQHEEAFWMWVASWALFIFKPSDLGYPDDGYVLPKLHTHWHRVKADQTRAWNQVDSWGQRKLFLDAAAGVTEASQEKHATMNDRIDKMMEIATEYLSGNPSKQLVIWCNLNSEQQAIEAVLKKNGITFSSVYGSLSVEEAERRLYEWKDKKTTVLLSKAVMLGSGVNLQQCSAAIYVGVDYKFQNFIQSIHRLYRFMQQEEVHIHVIYAESEDSIIQVLQKKWTQHDKLVDKMRSIVKQYGLTNEALKKDLQRSIGVDRMEVKGKFFRAINNDCVYEVSRMADNSVGLIHTSVPFGNHYEYSVKIEDFGHNPHDGDFWKQMDYLIPHLLRVLKPGRVCAVHVKDRILYGHQTKSGFMEVEEFSDDCVKAFKKHGFLYEGRRTIVTDVVRENNSTYRLGWTEMSKDSSKMGSGLPEYLLLFRKAPSDPATARADEPIEHDKEQYGRGQWQVDAHSLWRSSGNRLLEPEEYAALSSENAMAIFEQEQLTMPYDYERHIAASKAMERAGRLPAHFMLLAPKVTHAPSDFVWDDVVYMRTLNSNQSRGREQMHICPLPLDIVSRTVELYSNPGDIVLDPFAGLFTVPMMAIKLGRIGWGVELNDEYFRCGLKYCQETEQKRLTPTLFDYLETVQGAVDVHAENRNADIAEIERVRSVPGLVQEDTRPEDAGWDFDERLDD